MPSCAIAIAEFAPRASRTWLCFGSLLRRRLNSRRRRPPVGAEIDPDAAFAPDSQPAGQRVVGADDLQQPGQAGRGTVAPPPREFTGTFYEAQTDLRYGRASMGLRRRGWKSSPAAARSTTRLKASSGSGAAEAAGGPAGGRSGPDRRRVADGRRDRRAGLPAARRARNALKTIEAGPPARYKGSVALMWSHPSDEQAKVLAAAGVQGVVAFNARDRYFDPNQVVYASGPYGRHDPLAVGFTDLLAPVVRTAGGLAAGQEGRGARPRPAWRSHPTKLETVYSWIPGTEPEAKGVVFTAHLFDGYVKRGANDNMSGCVIELEILRGAPAADRRRRPAAAAPHDPLHLAPGDLRRPTRFSRSIPASPTG